MTTHILSNIKTSISSHTPRLQEAAIKLSNTVALSRVIPELNTIHGSNCVISGFLISNVVVNNDSCDVDVDSGKIVIDNTIVDVASGVTLHVDLTTNYIDDGLIFIFASFANYENNNELPFHLSVYLKQPDSSLYPFEFDPNVDKILLSVFSINLAAGTHDIKDIGDLYTRPIYNFDYNSNLISYRVLPTSELIINSRGEIYDFYNGNCVGGVSASAPPLENLLSLSIPQTTGSQFIPYTNTTVAVDGNELGEPLTYFLLNEPSGMTIDAVTGEISWSNPIAAFYTFTIGVQNLTFVSTIEYTLEILPNQPPSIINVPQITGVGGELLSITVDADDPDNDPLTYYLTNPPGDMSIGLHTGVITWNYPVNGIYNFGIYVNDGYVDSPTYNYTLTVENNFPIINSIDVVINASTFFADVINSGGVYGPGSGGDGSGGPGGGGGGGGGNSEGTGTGGGGAGTGEGVVIILTYSLAVGHPPGMVIDSVTGIIVWIAPPPGTYTYTIIATDQFGNEYTFTVIVTIGITYAIAGVNFGLSVNATDPESGSLSYGLIGEPSGMTIGTSGDINWPNPIIGNYTFQITVTDPYLNVTTADFELEIIELNAPQNLIVDLSSASVTPNQAPTVQPLTIYSNIGDVINEQLIFNDPDNDFLVWITTNEVTGLTLNQDGLITGTLTVLGTGQSLNYTVDDGFGHPITDTIPVDVINLNPVTDLVTELTDLTNQAPVSSDNSLQITLTNINDSFTYQMPSVTDPDGDVLSWSIEINADGLTVDDNGLVSGTTTTISVNTFDLFVDDGFGNILTVQLQINSVGLFAPTDAHYSSYNPTVSNQPTSILSETVFVNIDDPFTHQLTIADPENDVLVISDDSHATMTITQLGLVFGTPDTLGDNIINVSADDGYGHTTTVPITIKVVGLLPPVLDYDTTNYVFDNLNQPPVLIDTNLYFEINTVVNYQIQTTDPESNPLLFSIASGSFPIGLTMSDVGLITGTTDSNISIDVIGLVIDDGFGNVITPNLTIEVVNLNPPSGTDGVFVDDFPS